MGTDPCSSCNHLVPYISPLKEPCRPKRETFFPQLIQSASRTRWDISDLWPLSAFCICNRLCSLVIILPFLSSKAMVTMMRKAEGTAFPPVMITSCTFSPFSGRFCLPAFHPQSTGMVGPASWCPSASLASSLLSLEIWRHTLAALSASETLWLLWCLWRWELLFQVIESKKDGIVTQNELWYFRL